LNSQSKLFKINSFNFKLNHLIVIGVLILAFSVSFLIRSQPAEYGFELNEFDPFFNFRATQYMVENGFLEYLEWHDDKSWYPAGRNVSHTSQLMLHVTAATTYQIFGGNLSLYDFTILFPAIIGSLTVIVIFGLVRLFGGTLSGLIASLLFAVSLPIIIRGTIGWFKSEPLGIFYGLLGLYLFLSAIKSENKKIAFLKIISGAIVMSFAMSSWGGNQFFVIPIGLFILALPFVRKDHNFLLWCVPIFVGTFLLISGLFERPGPHFVFGIGGAIVGVPTIFLITCVFLHKISNGKNFVRN
jgi:dolichyl-diphosphooligosaccharide--protein glycosyltransferase